MADKDQEAKRLEGLWAGQFGNEYIVRNANAAQGRQAFWKNLLAPLKLGTILEVGCNLGGNLTWIRPEISQGSVCGIDINFTALRQIRESLPSVGVARAAARALPFRNGQFDFVFTMGVLIHIPPEVLDDVMREIVRASQRYVFAGEYYSETPTVVPYRGQDRALFKCNFGKRYLELFPELKLVKEGFLTKDQGWDRVTWWLFERP